MIGPTQNNYKKLKAKKMRRGGEGQRKKNGVLLILVSKLHVTEKGRKLETYPLKQLCKTIKNTSF